MPPKRQEMPASSAASVNVVHLRRTVSCGVRPGSILELPVASSTVSPKRSEPVHSERMRAAAALSALVPETYSGEGGVGEVAGS